MRSHGNVESGCIKFEKNSGGMCRFTNFSSFNIIHPCDFTSWKIKFFMKNRREMIKNSQLSHKNQTFGGVLRAISCQVIGRRPCRTLHPPVAIMALCDLCKIWQNYFLKIRIFSAQTVIKNTVFEKSWDICIKNLVNLFFYSGNLCGMILYLL